MYNPEGDHIYVVYVLLARDEGGEIIGGMLMSQDIIERKRMQNDLIVERAPGAACSRAHRRPEQANAETALAMPGDRERAAWRLALRTI
jgi:hypothetical protein